MCGEFDTKLEILYGKMVLEVINVLELFLAFVMTFNVVATHNMCALQLNPRFKGPQCIMEYVGWDKVATIVKQYD
jgi:hypothetical protein